MELEERLEGLVKWGHALSALVEELGTMEDPDSGNPLKNIIQRAHRANAWFIPEFTLTSVKALANWLDRDALQAWISEYPALHSSRKNLKTIGIVMAGNIPAVGFHDLLAVLISGHKAQVRCSSDDAILLPFLLEVLFDVSQEFKSLVQIGYKFHDFDAVIATGSNNTSRYFDFYFGKYPHIIRKNRNSAAVLTGDETDPELAALGHDIFLYFGLGCRNVSKLFVPDSYTFDRFFQCIESVGERLMQHNKYMNNYDYHRTLYLLNNEPFLTNNFLSLRESPVLSTPVSVLHYERYRSAGELKELLRRDADQLQCVVGTDFLPFGTTQAPGLADYADGVDTLQFLSGLDR